MWKYAVTNESKSVEINLLFEIKSYKNWINSWLIWWSDQIPLCETVWNSLNKYNLSMCSKNHKDRHRYRSNHWGLLSISRLIRYTCADPSSHLQSTHISLVTPHPPHSRLSLVLWGIPWPGNTSSHRRRRLQLRSKRKPFTNTISSIFATPMTTTTSHPSIYPSGPKTAVLVVVVVVVVKKMLRWRHIPWRKWMRIRCSRGIWVWNFWDFPLRGGGDPSRPIPSTRRSHIGYGRRPLDHRRRPVGMDGCDGKLREEEIGASLLAAAEEAVENRFAGNH